MASVAEELCHKDYGRPSVGPTSSGSCALGRLNLGASGADLQFWQVPRTPPPPPALPVPASPHGDLRASDVGPGSCTLHRRLCVRLFHGPCYAYHRFLEGGRRLPTTACMGVALQMVRMYLHICMSATCLPPLPWGGGRKVSAIACVGAVSFWLPCTKSTMCHGLGLGGTDSCWGKLKHGGALPQACGATVKTCMDRLCLPCDRAPLTQRIPLNRTFPRTEAVPFL